jgi:small-conductance mechanosensitive channel
MMLQGLSLAVDLLLVAVGATAVVGIGLAAAWLTEVVPLGSRHRRWLRRVRAPLGLLMLGVYTVVAAGYLAISQSTLAVSFVGALAIAVGLANIGVLKDVAAGVVLKSAGSCHIGDVIGTQNYTGKVTRMGVRSVSLALSDGDELVIPFSRVTSDILWLKAAGSALFSHSFVVGVAEPERTSTLFDRVRRAVLLHHSAACSRPPEIRVAQEGLEVTVFTLDERRGPEVERSVRSLLEQAPHSEG